MADYQSFEKDPRWTAVDRYAASHLQPASHPYHAALAHALSSAAAAGLPDIAVSPLQGQFLALQCSLLGARRVLELGTLGGYSTIWLASASPRTQVVSVELDPRRAEVARAAVDAAGCGQRVEIVVGAGRDVLPRLRAEVEEEEGDGKGERKFDFVFIDADKENNLWYLQQAVAMCREGACVVVDNVVRRGAVADEELAKNDATLRGSRAVIEGAAKDGRLECSLLQTVGEKNYDGMLICRVK